MRTLFVKIFVWFWLAITLLVGVQIVLMLTAQWERTSIPEITGQFLSVYGHSAAEILEREGPGALATHAGHAQKSGLRVLLLDESGREVCEQEPPPESSKFVAYAARTGGTEFHRSKTATHAARGVVGPSGKHYVALLQLPPSPMSRMATPLQLIPRLAAIIATVGLVCYALARWLTGPLRRLRGATAKLAAGDMTARVGPSVGKRRDEIGELGRDFDLMAGRIETLVNAQRQLLCDIPHELRSPLARQMIAIDLARADCGPEAADALDQMARDAQRLSELVSHLLTLSRLESGLRDERQMIDLAELVGKIAADAEFEAQSRGRHVRITQCDLCTTNGEVELLRRAVENVVRNAVYYTRDGTRVEISLQRIDGPPEHAARIIVRDQGPGVPEAALAEIFRPFYRLAYARDRQTGGAGLGLAITQRAIQLHGGSVEASNAPGGGLIVTIDLPTDGHASLAAEA